MIRAMNSSYSPLTTEDVDTGLPAQRPGSSTPAHPSGNYGHPPPYVEQGTTSLSTTSAPPHSSLHDQADDALPSYENATKLPSYQDVEKQKLDEARMEMIDAFFGTAADESEENEPLLNGIPIGSDCMFFFAFVIGFFFNWVGLFIGYFFMFSLAGQYGALAGFGTSMIKWLLYLRYSDCCQDLVIKSNVYVYLAMSLFAFVIIFKGVHSWLRIRPYLHQSSRQGTSRH